MKNPNSAISVYGKHSINFKAEGICWQFPLNSWGRISNTASKSSVKTKQEANCLSPLWMWIEKLQRILTMSTLFTAVLSDDWVSEVVLNSKVWSSSWSPISKYPSSLSVVLESHRGLPLFSVKEWGDLCTVWTIKAERCWIKSWFVAVYDMQLKGKMMVLQGSGTAQCSSSEWSKLQKRQQATVSTSKFKTSYNDLHFMALLIRILGLLFATSVKSV